MDNGFDPAKDDINREEHGLSLEFGHRIFKDADHLIIPSIRERDGEECFKVIGTVRVRLMVSVYQGVHLARRSAPVHIREREQQR